MVEGSHVPRGGDGHVLLHRRIVVDGSGGGFHPKCLLKHLPSLEPG